jgi:hypothetical protein
MTKAKVTYEFPHGISTEEVDYIQEFRSTCFEDGAIDDCQCPQMGVRIYGLTPLRSHFSAQLQCQCSEAVLDTK